MDSLSAQDRKQSERGAIKALRAMRLKMGFSDTLRLVVSLDLFTALMAAENREDWNLMKDYHEWQGLPILSDRRLERLDFEFVKVWTPRDQQIMDNRPRPSLSTGAKSIGDLEK